MYFLSIAKKISKTAALYFDIKDISNAFKPLLSTYGGNIKMYKAIIYHCCIRPIFIVVLRTIAVMTTWFINKVIGIPADKIALFWGLQFYNNELLQADEEEQGSVTTDILLEKDLRIFTLSNGWALPRRIYFSGEECEMPLPDTFPVLPNISSSVKHPHCLMLILLVYLTCKMLITWPW